MKTAEGRIRDKLAEAKNMLACHGGAPVRDTHWPSWPAYDEDTSKALLDVLESQRWAISGPYRGRPSYDRKFAAAFAEFHSVPYCTPVTNGSAALAITLRALDIGYGDKVVVPGLTWIACASSVTSVGAIPVPADIDIDTLVISPESLQQRLEDGANAVILVHPFCTVADPDPIVALCNTYHVPLIEDCSQAHGAMWRGQRVGTFGVAGVFSMQQSKVLTSGEGGALITRSRDLAEKFEQLRADGRVFSTSTTLNRLELTEKGDVQGHNHCLSEFQSAILLSRLNYLDSENQLRRTNAAALDEELATIPGVRTFRQPPHVQPTYYNYLFRISRSAFSERSVDEIAFGLSAELSLQISPVYTPLQRHRLFKYSVDPILRKLRGQIDVLFETYATQLPNCDTMRNEFITVPHVALLGGAQEISDIGHAVRKVKRLAHSLPKRETDNSAF